MSIMKLLWKITPDYKTIERPSKKYYLDPVTNKWVEDRRVMPINPDQVIYRRTMDEYKTEDQLRQQAMFNKPTQKKCPCIWKSADACKGCISK